MTIRTLLTHFTHRVLMKTVGMIALLNEDGTETYACITTEEDYKQLLENKTRVLDWQLTTTVLYIYIK